MKKTIAFILLFLAAFQQASATKRFVDPNVIPNTIPNVYVTPAAAFYQINNGDSVLIKPGNYNIGNLYCSKSFTMMPDTINGIVTLNGNFYLISPGYLKICNINLNGGFSLNGGGACYFIGVICNSLDANLGTKLVLINCSIGGDLVSTFSENEILKTQIAGTCSFYRGNFIASKTQNLKVGEGTGQYNDTINKNLIVADTIEGYFDYRCQDRISVIANNLINELDLYAWNHTVTKQNLIWNNEFYNNSRFVIAQGNVTAYNLEFSNNVFSSFNIPSDISKTSWQGNCGCSPNSIPLTDWLIWANPNYRQFQNYQNTCGGWNNWCYFHLQLNFSNQLSFATFPITDVPGIFKWTYNGFLLTGSGNGVYPFTNIAGTTNIVDAGNPDPKYMDIDMTVNDRGRLGGPYSILNYEPALNPSNGKAYIYDIELPDVINSPTQPIQIKSKGYHRN